MQRAALIARLAPSGLAIAGVALAVAIAAGAVGVPDVVGAVENGTRTLGPWIYLAVVALIFLETTTLVGFIINGELVLLVAGVAAERGGVSLPALVVLAAAAAVLGDVVSFLAGRRLGRRFLERHGTRFNLGPAQLVRVDRFFERHGGKALMLGRFTGFLRATMPFVAGSSDMPLRRLLRIGSVSALAWTTTFTVLGYASRTRSPAPATPRAASPSSPSCSPPRRSRCARVAHAATTRSARRRRRRHGRRPPDRWCVGGAAVVTAGDR